MGEREPTFGSPEPAGELRITIAYIELAALGSVRDYGLGDVLAADYMVCRQEGSLPVAERRMLAYMSLEEGMPKAQVLDSVDEDGARRYMLDDEGGVRRWMREGDRWIRDDGDDPEAEMKKRLEQFLELIEEHPEQFMRFTVAELLRWIAKSQTDTTE